MHHFHGRMTQQESLLHGGVSSEALRDFSNRPMSHWDKLIRLHSAQKLSHPQHFLMPHAIIIARRLSCLKQQEQWQQLSTRLVSAFVFRDFYPPSTPHFLAGKWKKASCNSSSPHHPVTATPSPPPLVGAEASLRSEPDLQPPWPPTPESPCTGCRKSTKVISEPQKTEGRRGGVREGDEGE